MPLLNYTPLADPVLISKVRASETELRQALADLETQYPDGRLYFPFGFSDKRELRAQQTYFVKMPQEVIEVLGLGDLERAAGPRLPPPPGSTGRPTGKADKRVGSGYMADSAVRSAIEWRAVNLAIEAYESDGYSRRLHRSVQPLRPRRGAGRGQAPRRGQRLVRHCHDR